VVDVTDRAYVDMRLGAFKFLFGHSGGPLAVNQDFLVIEAATFDGTSMYLANSMVYVARPWLIERMDVEYWNISASGTSAVTTLPDPDSSMPEIRPRRRVTTPPA